MRKERRTLRAPNRRYYNLNYYPHAAPRLLFAKLSTVHAFPTYIVINEEGIITQRIVGEYPRQKRGLAEICARIEF